MIDIAASVTEFSFKQDFDLITVTQQIAVMFKKSSVNCK